MTEALCDRWRPGVRLLPMSDDRVETHVVVDVEDRPGRRRAIHKSDQRSRPRSQRSGVVRMVPLLSNDGGDSGPP